jgi:organic radical activating enzyme
MKIAIYGAGKFGQYIYQCLNKKNDVTCFIDNDLNIKNKIVCGLKVIHIDEFNDESIDVVLVAFLGALQCIKELEKLRCKRIGIIQSYVFLEKRDFDICSEGDVIWDDLWKRPILWHLQTNIVDSCNLNCKGCSHFSNLFNQNDSVPFGVFCKDLDRISRETFICNFAFVGGEPFLHPNLSDYIDYARTKLPCSRIVIYTNGLLIPCVDKKILREISENRIDVFITGYKPTLKIMDSIKKELDSYNVSFTIGDEISSFGKNIDLEGSEDNINRFMECRESKCHFFRNGKIYKCPFAALGNVLFDYYSIDIHLNDGVKIHENTNWDNLVDVLDNMATSACKYCAKDTDFEWECGKQPTLNDWIV